MASQQDLQKVRQIVLAGLHAYPVKVLLFGSHATGRATRTSDIDVAVLPQHELPVGLLSQLREELEKSNVPYRVDLVDLPERTKTFVKGSCGRGLNGTIEGKAESC
jgi:predicted nucleotidyltransferase